jgi:hypothetical protein
MGRTPNLNLPPPAAAVPSLLSLSVLQAGTTCRTLWWGPSSGWGWASGCSWCTRGGTGSRRRCWRRRRGGSRGVGGRRRGRLEGERGPRPTFPGPPRPPSCETGSSFSSNLSTHLESCNVHWLCNAIGAELYSIPRQRSLPPFFRKNWRVSTKCLPGPSPSSLGGEPSAVHSLAFRRTKESPKRIRNGAPRHAGEMGDPILSFRVYFWRGDYAIDHVNPYILCIYL